MLREFLADLRKSVGAWRAAPLLPLLTLALQLPFYLQSVHPAWGVISMCAGIFYVGYVGTERLWYLAVWRGQPFAARDVWRTAWRYFPRYLVLGIVTFGIFLVLLIPSLLVGWGLDLDLDSSGPVLLILPTVLWDVWLTFTTPALAYSTDRSDEAMSIGWRFLKQHWRRCAPYALAPPLAGLVLLQRTPPGTIQTPVRIGLSAIGVLAYLALKGATAAYYVRHHGVSIGEGEVVPEGRGQSAMTGAAGT